MNVSTIVHMSEHACTNPLVTLAITTLNRPDYIRETLSATMAQGYPNLDILVSDNGSSNETSVLVKALIKNDPRARFRRNETTVPIHEHFTQCVQEARGEYFIILNDDDLINSDFVAELVGVAQRHPDVNVVVPRNATMDKHGAVVREFATPEGEVFDGPEFVCNWLYGRPPQLFINVTTVLARTNVIREFGGYRGLAHGHNIDNLLFLQCAITGPVGFAKGAVFHWRDHSTSLGNSAAAKQIVNSTRQFVRQLHCDPSTVKALDALPMARRKQILTGLRVMTDRELVMHMKWYDKSFRWKCGRVLSLCRSDAEFFFVVVRMGYRKLKQFFHPARYST